MRAVLAVVLLASLGSACGDDGAGKPLDAAVDDGPDTIDAATDAATDAAQASCTPRAGTTIMLAPVVSGLDSPIGLTSPPGDGRLYVVLQDGDIRIIRDGALVPTPFLSLGGNAGPVIAGGERGLLGLAFHPRFAENRKLYVNFTAKAAGAIPGNATVIAEYTAAADGMTADPATRRDLMVIPQPFSNHNGGWLEFGNDRLLYIGMGDGGSGGDPADRAQNDREWLGKMLRVDVDARTGGKPYGIPAGNPFAASADAANDPRPENWHKGLRNPFRWSFDRATGDLYIGDVGQSAWEEVDYTPNTAPLNFGWDDREGAHCYEPMTGCLTAGRTDPVAEHPASDNWRSVIGGQVYRGACFPDLVGTYFYGDYVAGELWALRIVGGAAQDRRRLLQNVGAITSIHADGLGELYLTTYGGAVRRVVVP
jgi:glucose/arabinose dehydrogenase